MIQIVVDNGFAGQAILTGIEQGILSDAIAGFDTVKGIAKIGKVEPEKTE